MARSRKKTPITANTCSESAKKFKVLEHRRERRKARQALQNAPEEVFPPHPKEYGNEWDSPRDGKHWFGNLNRNTQRYFLGMIVKSDPEYYKKLLRK